MDNLQKLIDTLACKSWGVDALETLAALSEKQYEALKNLFEAFGVETILSQAAPDSSFAKEAFDACERNGGGRL